MSNLQTLTIQRGELLAKIREIESSCEGDRKRTQCPASAAT